MKYFNGDDESSFDPYAVAKAKAYTVGYTLKKIGEDMCLVVV